jgi:hypothetical protein
MELEFPPQIFENIQISNIVKIYYVGAELFYAEGRTDRTKVIVAILRASLKMQDVVIYVHTSIG